MEEHIKKVYVPMTETGFYILYCLQEPMHGYNIVQRVLQLTDGEIRISPGTMYGQGVRSYWRREPCMEACPRWRGTV